VKLRLARLVDERAAFPRRVSPLDLPARLQSPHPATINQPNAMVPKSTYWNRA